MSESRPPASPSRGLWILIIVLLAPRGRPAAVGAALRQDRPDAVRLPVLLLVPVRADPVSPPCSRSSPSRCSRIADRRTVRPRGPTSRAAERSAMNAVAVSVFVFLFLLVTVLGFAAARWRRAETLDSLDEWGLGGRGFGTFIAWFLIGGDLYTAYTFIAVPATLYAGSVVGFFAVPYTIVVYPLIFLFLPRLWSVSPPARLRHAGRLRRRAATTAKPLGAGRRGHRHPRDDALHRAAARRHPGRARGDGHRHGSDNWFVKDLPLFIAFAVLAAYTYSSGLRAPALIAFVKDTLIYLVIIVAVIYLPTQLGGWGHIFERRQRLVRRRSTPTTPTRSRPGRRRRQGRSSRRRPRTGPTRRWRSARRWRCSCTRTRSPACSPPGTAR